MAVVVFDPAAFKARYPEFAAVDDNLLQAYFMESGLYLSNDDCSRVRNVVKRAILLNMITAHIAYLNGALSAGGTPPPVGRVSSATEGTVSASLDMGTVSGSQAWWLQTPYGAAYWQATLNLRGFHYIPRPTNPYGNNRF